MSDRDSRLMHQCWANRQFNSLGYMQRCLERVPSDPDHIGLCDGCLARLRGDVPQEVAA